MFWISSPAELATLADIHHVLVEGGALTASAFLAADLVDRLLLYRAPILIGGGTPALGDIGLDSLADIDHVLVEGGALTASAFLAADLVDRLLLYRAPILIGGGTPALRDIGLDSLADAHGRWRLDDARALGSDRLEVYERARER